MISIIIPTYNEEKALPKTLQALLSQPGEFETILVDGGSTDRTRAVVEDHISLTQHSVLSTVQLITAPKGRASQMNAGAKEAKGEWLLFLHADTILPDGAIQRLNDMETDQSIQAGGFMHQFSGDDWRL